MANNEQRKPLRSVMNLQTKQLQELIWTNKAPTNWFAINGAELGGSAGLSIGVHCQLCKMCQQRKCFSHHLGNEPPVLHMVFSPCPCENVGWTISIVSTDFIPISKVFGQPLVTPNTSCYPPLLYTCVSPDSLRGVFSWIKGEISDKQYY